MYSFKEKNKHKKKIIIISSVIVITFLLYYSLKLDRKIYLVENGCKSIVTVIEKVMVYPFTSLNTNKNIDQSESYTIQKNVNESLEKEIDELKKELELNKTLTSYDTINATVLSRNKAKFFNTITIDKGSKDGIKDDMAVVTYNGLIGKTIHTTLNSSEVKLITSDDLNYKVSVSVMTENIDSYAILSGYDNKTGYVKVTGVSKDSLVKEHDNVLTSGLSSMIPRGIYIGEVVKIEEDKYNLSKILYVKIKEDFNNIHYVTVLKEKK